MEEYIPNSIFVDDSRQRQIDAIVTFRNEVKEKNPDIFKEETSFILLQFSPPDTNRIGNPIGLNVLYSDDIPVPIREEFTNFVSEHWVK
jgi:hypothetical protein